MSLSSRVPDLTALDLLLSVARTGSLGRAAGEHGISQQAASSRMRTVERLVGVRLLERGARGTRLTSAGSLVAEWAGRLIDVAAELDAGIGALRHERDARLRVAASFTVAEYLLPGWLVALRDRTDPPPTVSLQVGNSREVAVRVLEGVADLGFVEGPDLPTGLRAQVVAHDELVVVVAPTHPWARRRRPLTPADLARVALVHREIGSGTRGAIQRALRHVGPLADPVLELASTAAVRNAVAAGAGPAVLSAVAVADDVASRRLVVVPVGGLELHRTLRAVWPSGSPPTGPARDLLALATRSGRRSLDR